LGTLAESQPETLLSSEVPVITVTELLRVIWVTS